jgi:hypothetical protein
VNSQRENEGNMKISNNAAQTINFQELTEYGKVQQQTHQPFINI